MMMMMMASSRKWSNGVKITVALMFIFSLTFFPSISAESMLVRNDVEQHLKKQMKMVLGSSPPRCVNRCMSCRPCTATLVVSPHHKNNLKATSRGDDDESYYLLSWKCRCRNKFFQP